MNFLILLSFILSIPTFADQTCKSDTDCSSYGSYFKCLTQKTGCPGAESTSTCASLQCIEVLPPKWFSCESHSDCVDISYMCAGGTVNKKFAQEANDLYRKQNSTRDCAQPATTGRGIMIPPFKVFCKEGKCGKQGKNPKT